LDLTEKDVAYISVRRFEVLAFLVVLVKGALIGGGDTTDVKNGIG